MAKWKEKKMVETPKGWKEHLAAGGSSAAQPMNNWLGGRCEHCYAKEGQYHHPFCDTQLKRQQDHLAYDMETERMKKAIQDIITQRHGDVDEDECPDCGDPICDCWLDDVDEGTEEWVKVTVQPAYYDLFIVLQKALYQAQDGKGAERHGNGLSFTEQPALTITRAVGLGFPLGQAMKKPVACCARTRVIGQKFCSVVHEVQGKKSASICKNRKIGS